MRYIEQACLLYLVLHVFSRSEIVRSKYTRCLNNNDQSRRGIMIIELPPSCDVFYFGSIFKGEKHVLIKFYGSPKHKISRKSVHWESLLSHDNRDARKKTSSVYDCTVEDVEYHNVSIVTHSYHLVVVITLP